MEREGYTDDTKFFIGTEVERSPAYGQKTLFVIGYQPKEEILARALNNNCPHIYLGANQSFSVTGEFGTQEETEGWDEMVTELLKAGFWVTLDYDVKHHDFVIESGYNEHDQFISMISVKLPYVEQLNYNACIKIDDTDFKATNPGVWVHRVHDLKNTDRFTDWREYTKDKPIKEVD